MLWHGEFVKNDSNTLEEFEKKDQFSQLAVFSMIIFG